MIGPSPPVCCFCGGPAEPSSMWFDYAGRPRHICERHREIGETDRNLMLLAGVKPSW